MDTTPMQLTKPGEPTPGAIEAKLTAIAYQHLSFQTLEARGRDFLDFKDCHCRSVRNALQAAYQAGRADQAAICHPFTKA